MPNKIQIKRTSVTGRTPNTTSSGNSSFIDTGELALNITDGKLFSSDGTNYIEVGANLNSLSVGGAKLTANATLVNAVALNVVNQTNTSTLFVTTSANVGTNVQITPNSFRLGNTSSNVNITNTQFTHLSNAAFNPQLIVRNSNNDEFGPYFITGKSRAGATVQNNDDLGTYMFQGHDGTDFRNTAYIVAEVDGTVSTSNVPSKMLFFTTNTSGNLLNRLTIFANGNINVNNGMLTIGSTVSVNTTLANLQALNVVNQTNTGTLFVTTSANVASAFLANSTGAYHTGTINAASYTVGTNFTSNSSQMVLNAPSYTVSFSNTNTSATNYITWSTSLQQQVPTTTTRSLGTKIIFYEGLSGSATDWAYGLAGNEMWASVGATTGTFRWYAVTTAFMTSNTTFFNHNAQVRVGGGVGTTNGTTVTNTSITVGNTATNSSLGVSTLNVSTTFTVNSISVNSTVNTSILAIIANGSIGTSGQVLTSNATGIYWGTVTGTAANPSGADTQVQFNDGGSAFGATAGFTFNKTTNNVTIANTLIVTAINANGSIGTAGQVLTSNATGIYWSTVSGGGGSGASLAEVRKSVSLRI